MRGGSAHRDGSVRPRPADQAALLDALRARAGAGATTRSRTATAFRCTAGSSVSRATTWSAISSACRRARRPIDDCPDAHYVAPRSLLVFDHLTRRAALLHAGSEPERAALRREVDPRDARRAAGSRLAGEVRRARGEPLRGRSSCDRRAPRTKESSPPATCTSWCCRCASPAAAISIPFETYRALRLLNPSPYMYYCELGERVVVGSSPEALVKLNGGQRADASDRRHAAARCGCAAGRRARSRTARRSEGECRARDAGGPRAQRSRPCRAAAGRVARRIRYRSIERYSHVMHIVSGVNGRARRGSRRVRPVRRGVSRRYAGRRAEGARHGAHRRDSSPCGAASTAARSATSVTAATWTRRSRSARWCFTATPTASRRAPASSPTACRQAEYREVLAKSAVLRRALELAREGL